MNLENFAWGASIKCLSLDVVFAIAFLVNTGIMQSPFLTSCHFICLFFFLFFEKIGGRVRFVGRVLHFACKVW
ncbi:hypothetical protein GLYMA_10G206200v4 [Glycine max]|uniref:Uncharacterized protein n=1 Tax=Glycine max TaxID=3847 RepID=K7LKJ8_SOYBN|nr:hypothetical protein GYH30_028619 [Glycine max]KRH34788.1 hypothetical protein GLYMA_10G206200v4 [Glycine max]